jgi:MinD-like ATPase involved in chromosome partitioning or flagellar assembly
VVAVASGKGGVGKSTLSLNRASPSAAALREIASRVLAALEEGAGP